MRDEPRARNDTDAVAKYLSAFESVGKGSWQDAPAWLADLRQNAIRAFAESGFPGRKDEEWRHTNLTPLLQAPFVPLVNGVTDAVVESQIEALAIPELWKNRLVFVNGSYRPALSSIAGQGDGITVGGLASVAADGQPLLEQHLARLADPGANPLAALNTAFAQDGTFVHIAEGASLEEPIYLLYLTSTLEDGGATHPRNLVVLSPHARVSVLEHYVSACAAAHFTNGVTELVVADGASLEHVRVQDECLLAFHVSATHGSLGRTANLVSYNLSFGARFARNDVSVALTGENALCTLNGVYLGTGERRIDNHTSIDHVEPACESHELYRGILGGKSRGVFRGRILVRPNAQKTDAKQTNNCLILSDEAVIDTMPQLEIFANDVKCTHGATVGELDEEAVFYLQARGIARPDARGMLTHAFASEVLSRLSNEAARSFLETRLKTILPQKTGV